MGRLEIQEPGLLGHLIGTFSPYSFSTLLKI